MSVAARVQDHGFPPGSSAVLRGGQLVPVPRTSTAWGRPVASAARSTRVPQPRQRAPPGGILQAFTTLRNVVTSIRRLPGFQNIATGLRWMACDDLRSLELLRSRLAL